ncbi:glycoside hydrolase family 6 protein [Streptomyces sp. GD-15H]|uniref:glycoside hydrolase family 6 protein n=1 Tax=Streptomyces sp. GD-15H TaxID=3129112 RepID=UPI0032444E68
MGDGRGSGEARPEVTASPRLEALPVVPSASPSPEVPSPSASASPEPRAITSAGAARSRVPVVVPDAIPDRDCGGHSRDGASDMDAYDGWIDRFAAGLRSGEGIVILEPDSLAQVECLCAGQGADRFASLARAGRVLTEANRSSGLSRVESAQPHAPNGPGRSPAASRAGEVPPGPRRTRPRGGDTHPVRGPHPEADSPHGPAARARPEATGRPRTITPVEQGTAPGAVPGVPERTSTSPRTAHHTARPPADHHTIESHPPARTLSPASSRRPRARVYYDAGHSGWNAPAKQADWLRRAGAASAASSDGVFSNFSPFHETADEVAHDRQVLDALGGPPGLGAVIDTSRNGNGAPADGEWCDPAGRKPGRTPTLSTGEAGIDAYLWVRLPGESDGCKGAPGTFTPSSAYDLAR